MKNVLHLYSNIPTQLRIFIAGNREIIFNFYPQVARTLAHYNIVYLEDGGFLFQDISFYCISMKALQTGNVLRMLGDTNFLVTHFPPEGILNENRGGALLKEIAMERPPDTTISTTCVRRAENKWKAAERCSATCHTTRNRKIFDKNLPSALIRHINRLTLLRRI